MTGREAILPSHYRKVDTCSTCKHHRIGYASPDRCDKHGHSLLSNYVCNDYEQNLNESYRWQYDTGARLKTSCTFKE